MPLVGLFAASCRQSVSRATGTGPWNVSLPDGNLGTANLVAVALPPKFRSTFSARVNDAAREASATINFSIGARSVRPLPRSSSPRAAGARRSVSQPGGARSRRCAASRAT